LLVNVDCSVAPIQTRGISEKGRRIQCEMIVTNENLPLLGSNRSSKSYWGRELWCGCASILVLVLSVLYFSNRRAAHATPLAHLAGEASPNIEQHGKGQIPSVNRNYQRVDKFRPQAKSASPDRIEHEQASYARQDSPRAQMKRIARKHVEHGASDTHMVFEKLQPVDREITHTKRRQTDSSVGTSKEHSSSLRVSTTERSDVTNAHPSQLLRGSTPPPVPRPLENHGIAQQELVLTARCSLPIDLNFVCSSIIQTFLVAEQARLQAEISRNLPPWVQGVGLSYESGSLIASPTVRLRTKSQHALFGFDPSMRLRCTFEALLRSPKVLAATKLLTDYSGGLCSSKTGVVQCGTEENMHSSQCDPIGDVLIPPP